MLDLKFIRENSDTVVKKALDKGVSIDIKEILSLDKVCRRLSLSVQKLQEQRNVAVYKKDIDQGKKIKQSLEKEEEEFKKYKDQLDKLLYQIPNPAFDDVPIGNESKNQVIKTVGDKTSFNFQVKDHLSLGESLNIIDVKRAAKVSGSRFAYLKNEGALLEFAIIKLVLDRLSKENFIPIIPPVMIRQEMTQGLGYWQNGGNENYYLVNDYQLNAKQESSSTPLYLIGTAEHAIAAMHKDEVFEDSDLPKKYVAFSSSFRREAGSYGKDTRGILRVHQFDKIEMVAFVKKQEDQRQREEFLSIVEGFMQDLKLPYQLVKLASGDISFPTAETIDVETWIPSEKKYRETHSISTTTSFQSRRLNIRYKTNNEKEYAHIINGTAFAIQRIIVAILENYQKEDGSVEIPQILQKYLDKKIISVKKI